MRSVGDFEAVLTLSRHGLNDCEISRLTGVPRSTVRGWRSGTQRLGRTGIVGGCRACNCPSHDFADLPSREYAYLLGQYVGDGCVTRYRRWIKLRIACCDAYPAIMDEVSAAMAAIVPTSKVGRWHSVGCTDVHSCSRQWPCLLPQDGPGRKHTREIQLTDWQIEHCERHPDQLLRSLIHSDGSRFMNRVRSPAGKTYEYPRYVFNNKSDDILLIFGAACERVGVSYTWCRDDMLAVSRRADVAHLDTFIGPKA